MYESKIRAKCLVIKSHRARFSWFVAHILRVRHVVSVAINSTIDSLLSREFPRKRTKKEPSTVGLTRRVLNLAKAKPNFVPFFRRELISSRHKRARHFYYAFRYSNFKFSRQTNVPRGDGATQNERLGAGRYAAGLLRLGLWRLKSARVHDRAKKQGAHVLARAYSLSAERNARWALGAKDAAQRRRKRDLIVIHNAFYTPGTENRAIVFKDFVDLFVSMLHSAEWFLVIRWGRSEERIKLRVSCLSGCSISRVTREFTCSM